LSGQVLTNQTIEHYKLLLSLRDNFSERLQRSSLGNSELKFLFKLHRILKSSGKHRQILIILGMQHREET